MATTRVPASWVQRRELPRLCARHDAPATHLDDRSFYTRTPPWVVLTVFVAVLLFVILALALRTTVKGALPACQQCVRDRRRFLQRVWGGWAGAAVVLAAAISTNSGILLLLALLILIGAIVMSCCGDRFRVSGFVSKDAVWIDLKGVGPEFARIVAEGLRPQPQVVQPHASLPPIAAAYLAPQQVAAPSAPPQLSADGYWWWDGTQWVPAARAGLTPA